MPRVLWLAQIITGVKTLNTQISGYIRKREGETEAIFRSLVRFTPGSRLHDSHDGANESRKQETTVWILIALLGLFSIVALYMLWFRTGGLYAVADSREMIKADSRSNRTRSSSFGYSGLPVDCCNERDGRAF